MLAAISAGLGSLKMATDIVKGLNAANTQAAINDVKLTLQERIFEAREALTAAQDAQATALQRIRELESRVAELEAWGADKQRYELTALKPGVFAYAVKEAMRDGEPPHHICAACYQRGKKGILQFFKIPEGRRRELRCPECKNTVDVSGLADLFD